MEREKMYDFEDDDPIFDLSLEEIMRLSEENKGAIEVEEEWEKGTEIDSSDLDEFFAELDRESKEHDERTMRFLKELIKEANEYGGDCNDR